MRVSIILSQSCLVHSHLLGFRLFLALVSCLVRTLLRLTWILGILPGSFFLIVWQKKEANSKQHPEFNNTIIVVTILGMN